MGLMGTLAKVAIGYAAARGVDKLSAGGGLGSLLGGGAQIKTDDQTAQMQAQGAAALSGQTPQSAQNPMADMMARMQQGGLGAMMGGAAGSNPLADIMGKMQEGGLDMSALMGGTGGPAADPEAEPGGLLSALGGGGAGLAGMLAGIGGMAAQTQGSGVAGLLDAFNTKDTAPEAEQSAGLMLRAMIMAAKSDGGIDEAEKARLMDTIGEEADPADMAFVQAQLSAPVDPEALAAETPEAQRMQVYSASLMTIRVDTQAEAQYLDRLARAMHLDAPTVNTLHMQMGMQPLYSG